MVEYAEQTVRDDTPALKRVARRLYARAVLRGRYSANGSLPPAPRAVIVCSGGNMGGTIISLPLIQGFRARFSSSHLAVVCNTNIGADVVRFAGVGDSVHVLDPAARTRDREGRERFDATLRELSDLRAEVLVTNCDSNGTERFLLPLRIPVRIGHTCTLEGTPLAWATSNVGVDLAPETNWLQAYGQLLDRVSAGSIDRPRLNAGVADADALLRGGGWHGGAVAALQADVWKAQVWKQWPLDRLFAVAERLWERRIQPVLLGGTRISFDGQLPPHVPFVNLTGATTFEELVACVSRCIVAITNDSGIMHLAASLDVPTVAVYGMTDPRKTWVYGDSNRHRIVRRDDCIPCYSMLPGFPEACPHRKCLMELSVDAVWAAVDELLQAAAPSNTAVMQ